MPVAAALRAAGLWSLEERRDFDAEDWWYRGRFSVGDPGRPARLRFEGLATIADVWLNREAILHSETMFAAHTVDLPQPLRQDNELVLRFHALGPLLAARRPRPRWRSRLVSHQALRWFRTSLLGRMPGWCPPVAPVGPWRPILIETVPSVIERADIDAHLDGNDGVVTVRLRTRHPASLGGTISVGDCHAPLPPGGHSPDEAVVVVVRVPRPDRWWPHTHGPQPLYTVRASIENGATATTLDLGRIGFRAIQVDRGRDGKGFGLVVNGAPLFCRGACWTPLDLATLSGSEADYRTALEQLRDAGMNMIRVGGTMTYEADAFYDLCDQLGILVWQDFMFANMDYPADDDTFARSVSVEATQIVERLQSRPSLAVICGSSEVEQQAAMLGLPAERRRNQLFEQQLPGIVHRLAPHAAWLPSTPTGGTFAFHVDSGAGHYYGVGAYLRPFEDARRANVRFASECLAFSNVPDATTVDLVLAGGETAPTGPRWKSPIPRDPGVGWDFEDVRDYYVERLFGHSPVELRARDPERYLALGRVATGEAMLRTFAEWRRPGSTCRGALVWFARDVSPGAGWGIVDSTGRPKAAYWYLKRVLAPVVLLAADEGLNGLWLHAVNDTAEDIEVDLRVMLFRDGSRHGAEVGTTLVIPGRGYRSIHADALFDGFLDLTYAYRFGPPGHDLVSATLTDRATGAPLAEARYFPLTIPEDRHGDLGLTARAEPLGEDHAAGYELIMATSRFAHAVAIDIDGWAPADNYVDLEPGRDRRIALRPTAGGPPRGEVWALNGRGPVSIAPPEGSPRRSDPGPVDAARPRHVR
jgi:beta-mannosidase